MHYGRVRVSTPCDLNGHIDRKGKLDFADKLLVKPYHRVEMQMQYTYILVIASTASLSCSRLVAWLSSSHLLLLYVAPV